MHGLKNNGPSRRIAYMQLLGKDSASAKPIGGLGIYSYGFHWKHYGGHEVVQKRCQTSPYCRGGRIITRGLRWPPYHFGGVSDCHPGETGASNQGTFSATIVYANGRLVYAAMTTPANDNRCSFDKSPDSWKCSLYRGGSKRRLYADNAGEFTI